MDRYIVSQQINAGAFGSVFEAVAIKKVYKRFYEFNLKQRNREVKALKALNHPNLISMLDFVVKGTSLYFIFEYMDMNLYEVLQSRSGAYLPRSSIRSITYQILSGLSFMHGMGLFHRDLKPENILVSGRTIKIADFGLVRETDKGGRKLTPYVSTRWYRAPEVILSYKHYTTPIDLWAVGCITIELMTGLPLFPGDHDLDMLHRITTALGSPNDKTSFGGLWVLGVQLAAVSGYRFPKLATGNLLDNLTSYPSLDDGLMEFVINLIQYDPNRRLTAKLALAHPFLNSCTGPVDRDNQLVNRPNFINRKDIFDDLSYLRDSGTYSCTEQPQQTINHFDLNLGVSLEQSISLGLNCNNFPTPTLNAMANLPLRPSTSNSSLSDLNCNNHPLITTQSYADPRTSFTSNNRNLDHQYLDLDFRFDDEPFSQTFVTSQLFKDSPRLGCSQKFRRLSLYDSLDQDEQIYLTISKSDLEPKLSVDNSLRIKPKLLAKQVRTTNLRRKSNLASLDFQIARKVEKPKTSNHVLTPNNYNYLKDPSSPNHTRHRTRPVTFSSPSIQPYLLRKVSIESTPEPLARELLTFMSRTLDNVATDSSISKLSQSWNAPTLTNTMARPSKLMSYNKYRPELESKLMEPVPLSIVNSSSTPNSQSESNLINLHRTNRSLPTRNRYNRIGSYREMDEDLYLDDSRKLNDVNRYSSHPTHLQSSITNPHTNTNSNSYANRNCQVILATATTLNMPQIKFRNTSSRCNINPNFYRVPATRVRALDDQDCDLHEQANEAEDDGNEVNNERQGRRSSLGNLLDFMKKTLFKNTLNLPCSPNNLKNQFSNESIYQPPNINNWDFSTFNGTNHAIGMFDFERED